MDTDNKYYSLIEKLVKSNRKFPGCESIIDEIIDDVYSHAQIVINSIQNEAVIEKYLDRIVLTSIITMSKKHNIKRQTTSHAREIVITEKPNTFVEAKADNNAEVQDAPIYKEPAKNEITHNEVEEAPLVSSSSGTTYDISAESNETERANTVYVFNMINSIASDTLTEQEEKAILDSSANANLSEVEGIEEHENVIEEYDSDLDEEEALPEPVQEEEPLNDYVDPAADSVSDSEEVELSAEGVELPVEDFELPAEDVELPAEGVELPAEEVDDFSEHIEDLEDVQDAGVVEVSISEETETAMDSLELVVGSDSEEQLTSYDGTTMEEVVFDDADVIPQTSDENEDEPVSDMEAVDLNDVQQVTEIEYGDEKADDLMESVELEDDNLDVSRENESDLVAASEVEELAPEDLSDIDEVENELSEIAAGDIENISEEPSVLDSEEFDFEPESLNESDAVQSLSTDLDELDDLTDDAVDADEFSDIQDNDSVIPSDENCDDMLVEEEAFDIKDGSIDNTVLEADGNELELGFPENEDSLGDIELNDSSYDLTAGQSTASIMDIPYEPEQNLVSSINDEESTVLTADDNNADNESEDIPFRPVNYSVFAFEGLEKHDSSIDVEGLSDKILSLHQEHPELNIVSVFELKYKKNMSLDDISKELSMEKADVLSALRELVDIV